MSVSTLTTKRRPLSLRAVLAASLLGVQFIAVSTIVGLTFVSSERALLRQSEALLTEAGKNVISHVESFVSPAQQLLDVSRRLAENGLLDVQDNGTLERHLFQQLIVVPQIAGIYFAEDNGRFVYVMRTDQAGNYRSKFIQPFALGSAEHPADFIWRDDQFKMVDAEQSQDDRYEARTRPWFTQVRDQNESIWTSPYIYFTTGRAGITYAVPVLAENGDRVGTLGIDIEIDALSEFLSDVWEDKGGAVLLLSSDGDVLAHPTVPVVVDDADRNRPELVSISNIDDTVARQAFELSRDGSVEDPVFAQLSINEENYVTLLMPMPDEKLDWTVGLYAPSSFFAGEILNDRSRWIWFAIFVTCVAGLVGLGIAQWINRPLQRFATGTAMAVQGNSPNSDDIHSPYAELDGAADTLMSEIRRRRHFEVAYGKTFEFTSRGMAQINPNSWQIVLANNQLCALFGVEQSDVEGLALSELLSLNSAREFDRLTKRILEEREVIEELCVKTSDDAETWIRINALLVTDADNRPEHVIALFDNVSDQKHSERLQAELKRDISHLSRINIMGEMASGLAHELNQPLSAIAHNADAAKNLVSQLDAGSDELVEVHTAIERQALRAGEIIHALRDFVRKDRGRLAPFDIYELCKQTCQLMRPEAQAKNVDIRVVEGDPAWVMGNRTQIAQVIVNLVVNSIEAIDLTTHGERQIIVAVAKNNDGFTSVCVKDTGAGLHKDVELFKKFDTFKPDGMGLGLSISRSIVEANDGEIWYEPQSPRGAKFYFNLRSVENDQRTR